MLPSWYIEILEKKCWCYQCFVDQIRELEAVFNSVVHWNCLSTRSLATIIRLYLSWRKRRAIKSKKPKALLMVIIPMHWHLICSKLDGSWSIISLEIFSPFKPMHICNWEDFKTHLSGSPAMSKGRLPWDPHLFTSSCLLLVAILVNLAIWLHRSRRTIGLKVPLIEHTFLFFYYYYFFNVL
jgi:hypothetical protein